MPGPLFLCILLSGSKVTGKMIRGVDFGRLVPYGAVEFGASQAKPDMMWGGIL